MKGKVDGIYRSYIQHASPSPTSASDFEASGTDYPHDKSLCLSNHQSMTDMRIGALRLPVVSLLKDPVA